MWPLCGGRLTKPSKDKLCYIPQRPYLALGTLRDQIIFPDSREDMASRGATDADIIELLRQVCVCVCVCVCVLCLCLCARALLQRRSSARPDCLCEVALCRSGEGANGLVIDFY